MVERIGSRDARRMFADLLGRVRYGGEVIIVERAGTPMAAMVPVELVEQLLAEREARFEVLDPVREAGAASDEGLGDTIRGTEPSGGPRGFSWGQSPWLQPVLVHRSQGRKGADGSASGQVADVLAEPS